MSFAAIIYEGGPFHGCIERVPQPENGSAGYAGGCEISLQNGCYIVEAPVDPDDDKGHAIWHEREPDSRERESRCAIALEVRAAVAAWRKDKTLAFQPRTRP